VPLGRELVVMPNGAAATVSVRLTEVVCGGLPESFAVKVSARLVAGTDGVPVMAPVDEFKDRPVGNKPEVSDQVNGVVPPVAARVVE